MKPIQIITSLVCLTFLSCDNARQQQDNKDQTPKALQEESSYVETYSKRGYGDLVESLYKELVDKSPDLKELEETIVTLQESQHDSLKAFNEYNEKNQSYFNSANNHNTKITDSVLREKMRFLIESSMAKYKSRISNHTNLLERINIKNATLNDLHEVLKISKTLPVIEKYQRDYFPSTKPIEGFEREMDKAIRLADTLTKK